MMITIAAETFAVTPNKGSAGNSLTGKGSSKIFNPLNTTIMLVENEHRRVRIITSHFCIHSYPVSNLLRSRVGQALDLPGENVFTFSSHNYTDVAVSGVKVPPGIPSYNTQFSESQLTCAGRQILNGLLGAAYRLPDHLKPVSVEWGVGHEWCINHNRKGRRAGCSTYLMREEDRLVLGKDFNGHIDDDAPVIAFIGIDRKPVCFLVQFTGHPVTAYHPEHLVTFGEYPLVACDDFPKAFGGVPVGFLQGCSGDHNSKELLFLGKPLQEKVAASTRYGRMLGNTFIKTAKEMQRSDRNDLAFAWEKVWLPLRKVPPEPWLRKQLIEIENFLKRCQLGDEDTRSCVGLNFLKMLSPRYRAELVKLLKQWTEWALGFHKNGRIEEAPKGVASEIVILRLGDVGIVGLSCEPFSGIWRQIKNGSPLAIPCGYANDSSVGYVPDGANTGGDLDYISSYYRYTTRLLPKVCNLIMLRLERIL